MDPHKKTKVRFAAGIRQFLNPPLPDGYYGNAFITMDALLTGRDLDEGPLSKAVKVIKESKNLASTNDYIMKRVSMFEKQRQLINPFEAKDASLVLSDWRQFGVIGVGFGWKNFLNPISLPWTRYDYERQSKLDCCVFMPPCTVIDPPMEGGVKVHLSLPRAAIAKFKEDMDALKHI
ncbi:hypothetical protein REPUB_Repub11eG0194900 [Reevesia pubescens]